MNVHLKALRREQKNTTQTKTNKQTNKQNEAKRKLLKLVIDERSGFSKFKYSTVSILIRVFNVRGRCHRINVGDLTQTYSMIAPPPRLTQIVPGISRFNIEMTRPTLSCFVIK